MKISLSGCCGVDVLGAVIAQTSSSVIPNSPNPSIPVVVNNNNASTASSSAVAAPAPASAPASTASSSAVAAPAPASAPASAASSSAVAVPAPASAASSSAVAAIVTNSMGAVSALSHSAPSGILAVGGGGAIVAHNIVPPADPHPYIHYAANLATQGIQHLITAGSVAVHFYVLANVRLPAALVTVEAAIPPIATGLSTTVTSLINQGIVPRLEAFVDYFHRPAALNINPLGPANHAVPAHAGETGLSFWDFLEHANL